MFLGFLKLAGQAILKWLASQLVVLFEDELLVVVGVVKVWVFLLGDFLKVGLMHFLSFWLWATKFLF